jgi:hypothetical protein
MPSGLAVPIGVGPTGGAKISSGNEQADKIIRLTLGDDESDNPFHDFLGLDQHIFELPSTQRRGVILTKLKEKFNDLEQLRRFRLLPETITWDTSSEAEETLIFKYVDLETDEVRASTRAFTG